MAEQIDHVVIAVNDLAVASQSFSDLGFTVTLGGEHSFRKSHNALITFQDGSYIEIIAFLEDGPRDDPWWQLLQLGEGWVDHALLVDDLQQLLDRGVEGVRGPVDGGRHTPAGETIEWRTARFPEIESVKRPFFIEDITDRSLRVPGGDAAVHPNGATGIRSITSLVSDLDSAAAQLGNLLGQEGSAISTASRGFELGDQHLVIYAPNTSEDAEAASLLQKRGPLPYEVEISLSGAPAADETRGPVTVHGSRITFVSN